MPNGSCCMYHAFAVLYDFPSWSRVYEQGVYYDGFMWPRCDANMYIRFLCP